MFPFVREDLWVPFAPSIQWALSLPFQLPPLSVLSIPLHPCAPWVRWLPLMYSHPWDPVPLCFPTE